MFRHSSNSIILCAAIMLSLAGVQECVASPPLYTCANIASSGCRFGNPSVRCPSVCSYFFDAVEAALVNDPSALYTLQRAFFPDGEQRPNVVDIYLTLILEQVVDLPCDSEMNKFRDTPISLLNGQNDILDNFYNDSEITYSRREFRWHHVWTSAVLTNVIERESLGLISTINTLAYITRLYSEAQFTVIVTSQQTDFQPREVTFLELSVPVLLCLPNNTEDTLQGAWEGIMPWIHTYTIERGRISYSNNERAFIFEDSNIDPDSERIFGTFQRREVDQNVFVTYLTALHILLQVAVGLTIMKLIPTYYKSVSETENGKMTTKNTPSVSIFWANVIFAAVIDMLFIGVDLFLIVSVYRGVDDAISAIISTSDRSALQTVFAFGVLGTLVTVILIFIQLFVAAGIAKNTIMYVPGLFTLFCCFFKCRCKRWNGEFWNKVLHTFAIWFLMAFLQLVAGSVIPYLVLAIVNPVPSVTFLALGASTLFCLIIFVASLLQVSVQMKKTSCYDKVVALVQGLVFIVFLGLVAITVIIYQGVIQSGTSTGVVSGIALSLVPSAIIAVLGFAVKSKLLRDGDEDKPKEQESLFTRATSILRNKIAKEPTIIKKTNKVEETSDSDANCNHTPEKGEETVKSEEVNLLLEEAANSNDPPVDKADSQKLEGDGNESSSESGFDTTKDSFSNPLYPDDKSEKDGDIVSTDSSSVSNVGSERGSAVDRKDSGYQNASTGDETNANAATYTNEMAEQVLTIDFTGLDTVSYS